MIVSWKWLHDYVKPSVDVDEMAHRLAMAGLNHEGTETVDGDFAVDLEVTSNRPDCLGHIGVAREISVLLDLPLSVAEPLAKHAAKTSPAAADLAKVSNDCPELCYRYTARVIRGLNVGPTPDWMAARLQAIGQPVINNIVDISNYVMMECGQPLHAFDLAKLAGPEIRVREAVAGETFTAIDHKTYALEPGMCVIADGRQAVALGGVMGGADTEVTEGTSDVLIEAAEFAPLSVRTTARKLKLHSPSSYRFERSVDPQGVDWASRRCCELILELAGGELADGVLEVGRDSETPRLVRLRFGQLLRVLGIELAAQESVRILTALGCQPTEQNEQFVEVRPPSWRRDLPREIDLIEEVARIHGYDKIPEDVGVPMAPSYRGERDRVLDIVRGVLTAAGFDEATTRSVVSEMWSNAFSPWSDDPAMRTGAPMVKGADHLRRSLTPSLLGVRQTNEAMANSVIELFETAKVYLPGGDGELPREQSTLGVSSGGDFYQLKGVVECLVKSLNPSAQLQVRAIERPQSLLDSAQACELLVGGHRLGTLGVVSAESCKQFKLRNRPSIAELNLETLGKIADLVRQHHDQPPFPAISRDINVIVDEQLPWSAIEHTIREHGGELLEQLSYLDTYRDAKTDGANRKRLLFNVAFRSPHNTMTNEQADEYRDAIIAALKDQHGGLLLS